MKNFLKTNFGTMIIPLSVHSVCGDLIWCEIFPSSGSSYKNYISVHGVDGGVEATITFFQKNGDINGKTNYTLEDFKNKREK